MRKYIYTGIISIIVFYVFFEFYTNHQYQGRLSESPDISKANVDSCKEALYKAYFKGVVSETGPSILRDRATGSIFMKIIDSAYFQIPSICKYLNVQDGLVVLNAAYLNINAGPNHEIEKGDLILKRSNDYKVYILSSNGDEKYYFELFDGLGSEKFKMGY